jgi:serine/threonine protein kinase
VTPERWRQVTDLFHAALEHEPEARDLFVHGAAGSDEELEREVVSLLRSHRKTGGYLEMPAWEVSTELLHDAEALAAGHSIGKYRIVREVARGGMGVVYRATDEVLGRSVALKALPAEYAHDRLRRERLVREAKLSAQLNHRAIATVYELVETDDQLFMASEFVQGITLRRELADGPLPPGHLLGTLIEIAGALAAAHSLNIIHRDLKPENIIRREDGQIKVLDFGLARTMSPSDFASSTHLTELSTIAGTPGYMAPEVLSNRPADARSDIFVLGLVAWELATGRHPLGAGANSQMARLLDMTAGAEPAWAGPLPVPGLEPILRRCVARLPEHRYQSAEALVDDLRSLQRSTDSTVAASTAPSGLRLWWWQFHQATTAAVVASAPIWGWIVREWISLPRGAWIFFAILALATASVILRLNMLFTSRVQPEILAEHHARLSKWVPWTEGTLCLLLLWTAATIGSVHEAWAALLIGLAILIGASLAVIEPTTTRGAGLNA